MISAGSTPPWIHSCYLERCATVLLPLSGLSFTSIVLDPPSDELSSIGLPLILGSVERRFSYNLSPLTFYRIRPKILFIWFCPGFLVWISPCILNLCTVLFPYCYDLWPWFRPFFVWWPLESSWWFYCPICLDLPILCLLPTRWLNLSIIYIPFVLPILQHVTPTFITPFLVSFESRLISLSSGFHWLLLFLL